jgi:hypothetical protein
MHSPSISGSIPGQPVVDHVDSETKDIDKALEAGQAPVVDVQHPVDKSDRDGSAVSFTFGAQNGVKNMEATTAVWDKKSLIAAYAMIWIIAFMDGKNLFSYSARYDTNISQHCSKVLHTSLLLTLPVISRSIR